MVVVPGMPIRRVAMMAVCMIAYFYNVGGLRADYGTGVSLLLDNPATVCRRFIFTLSVHDYGATRGIAGLCPERLRAEIPASLGRVSE